MTASVWETPESVARFAERDPDVRLVELLGEIASPASFRVLDLGCAAGRNTVALAERGFDFQALDGSQAMIEHTRARVAAILGEDEARRRVHRARMDDLGRFATASFDLEAGYTPNRLTVFEPVGDSVRTIWRALPPDWGPERIRWLAEDTLLVVQAWPTVSGGTRSESREAVVVRTGDDWTLRITDNLPGDNGELRNWTIQVSTEPIP